MDRVCDECLIGKQRRAPFPEQSVYRVGTCLELVHADLCGSITAPTLTWNQYFIFIVDDKSLFMWAALPKSKDQTFVAF